MILDRRTFLGMAGGLVLAGPVAAQPKSIPIELADGKILVPVMLNGQPVQAMLDSGATLYGLDIGAAERLSLKADGRRVTARGVQHVLRGRFGEARSLVVGGVDLGATPMLVLDYGDLLPGAARRIEAGLGGAFFRRFVVELDLAAKTLRLHERAAFEAPSAPAVLVPLTESRGFMTAPVGLGEHDLVQAVVDTGSDPPLIVSPGPARRLGLLGGDRPASTAPLGGVGGVSIARITSAPRITLGGEAFADVPVQVPARGIGLDANLGLGLLARFHLWLDFGGQRMWLAPRGQAPAFRRDLVGFYGVISGDALKVTHVAPGGPAAAAGFRVGETIASINGEVASIANQTLKDTPEGVALTFGMANGKSRHLTLSRYY